jgi:hypothetical protein
MQLMSGDDRAVSEQHGRVAAWSPWLYFSHFIESRELPNPEVPANSL